MNLSDSLSMMGISGQEAIRMANKGSNLPKQEFILATLIISHSFTWPKKHDILR